MIAAQPYGDPVRLAIAKNYGLRKYRDYCAAHGETDYSVKTAQCLACHAPPMTERQAARQTGQRTFLGVCETHGQTAFGVQSGKCLTCFNALGYRRAAGDTVRGDPNRIAARHAGSKIYLGRCETCGPTRFSTGPGKCLTCFNAMGYPRP